MDTTKLKSIMSKFSMEDLRFFLGDKLHDSLAEWKSGEQLEFTKRQISEMIISVHGVGILKNRIFRKRACQSFSDGELAKIEEFFGKKFNNKNELCEKIAASQWKLNAQSKLFLEILELPFSVFDKSKREVEAVVSYSAYDKFNELLDYQYVIRQRILTELNSDVQLNRMLVHMPTGTGKTKTMMHTLTNYFISSLEKRGLVIWIAHTSELLQQAYETFISVWKHLGQGSVNVHKFWANNNLLSEKEALNGIMFCGIQKLCSVMRANPEVFLRIKKDCRLIVFDEAHKAAAPETSIAVNELMHLSTGFQDRSLVGLTATPGRSTEYSFDNNLLVSMFGNRFIKINTKLMNEMSYDTITALNMPVEKDIIKFFQSKKILAKLVKEELTYKQSFTENQISALKKDLVNDGYADEDFSQKALEIIGRNRERNHSIMKKLRELAKQKIPTIVFACSVEHAQLLSAMLSIEKIPNAIVIGEMPVQERKDAISSFKDRENPINIIINFEVLTTGFDSTNIRCVFITRPTQSIVLYSQMIGRGLRGQRMGGNAECILVDIKDNIYKYDEERAFSHFNNYWKN